MGRRIAFGGLVASWVALLVVLAPLVLAEGGPPPEAKATAPGDRSHAQRDSVSIAWAGDITLGSRYGLPPDGGRALFGNVRRLVSGADLALGNLEGTLSAGGASKCGQEGGQCFSFQAPPENAQALRWAGFDLLNLANNHAFGFGESGQSQTVSALDSHGLGHTGRPGQMTIVRRAGVRVAIVGLAPYPWASDLRDLAGVRDLVERAATKADIVVVLAHLGAEGTDQSHTPVGTEYAMGENRGDTRAVARTAVDAGADLILGSGPHILRGMELYRGKLIAYSLGNFTGWHNFSTAGELALSGLLVVDLSRDGRLRGRSKFTPLRLDSAGVPAVDESGEATQLINQRGQEDFGPTALRLLRDGSF